MYNSNFAERYSQPSVPLLVWKAALYIRLSREDGDKAESYSVSSQREILKEYLKQHPDIELYDIYIDDGYSGTNFNRPGFTRMMEAVYSGNVNCVIVKDLSRFGRNYTDAGNYLDNIFVVFHIILHQSMNDTVRQLHFLLLRILVQFQDNKSRIVLKQKFVFFELNQHHRLALEDL